MKAGMFRIKASDGKMREMSAKVREDGLLIMAGSPIFVGADFTDAGLPIPTPNLPVAKYTDAEIELALTVDHPRVQWHSDSDYASMNEKCKRFLAGEPEDTRERQNAFLKEKGYRWEKRGVYHSNPGDMVDAWFLLDPNGDAVVGAKDAITVELATFGSVKSILTELGYYGQAAVDTAKAETEKRQERHEMRAKVDAYFDDANRTGEVFEDAQSKFTVRPIQLEQNYPRRQFRIEDDCIWHETHNRSDGDDWSLNNSDYGIATQYKFDAEIAKFLRTLAS